MVYALGLVGLWLCDAGGRPDHPVVPLLKGALTAALVWRTVQQESWLRRLSASGARTQAGRDSFSSAEYVLQDNPTTLRWLARVAAASWVWLAPTFGSPGDPVEGFLAGASYLAAGLLLLGGPVVGFLTAVCVVLSIPFLVTGGAVAFAWLGSQLLWMIVSSFRSPRDWRTNYKRGSSRARAERPWFYLV